MTHMWPLTVKNEIDSYSKLPHTDHRSCWQWSLCQHKAHHRSMTTSKAPSSWKILRGKENFIRINPEFSTRRQITCSIRKLNFYFAGTKHDPDTRIQPEPLSSLILRHCQIDISVDDDAMRLLKDNALWRWNRGNARSRESCKRI